MHEPELLRHRGGIHRYEKALTASLRVAEMRSVSSTGAENAFLCIHRGRC